MQIFLAAGIVAVILAASAITYYAVEKAHAAPWPLRAQGGQFPVDARCFECGHMFRPSLTNIRTGHGCPVSKQVEVCGP